MSAAKPRESDPSARTPAQTARRTRRTRQSALTATLARKKVAPAVRGAGSLDEQALDLALIGNCRIAALVNPTGRIVWWCFPRFDSDPVFSRLLAGDEEKGFCDVVLTDLKRSTSTYIRNTPILETVLEDEHG